MKLAQQCVAQANGQANTHLNVFGKAAVIARTEVPPAVDRHTADRPAKRAFRRDMDHIGPEIIDDFTDCRAANEREANLRVGRTGNAAELRRIDDQHFMAESGQFARSHLQGSHDPIDLRIPRLGCDQYLHLDVHACWNLQIFRQLDDRSVNA